MINKKLGPNTLKSLTLKSDPDSLQGKEMIVQIAQMFQIWYHLVEKDLKIPNLSKIVDFCEVLLDR